MQNTQSKTEMIEEPALRQLRTRFSGELIRPGDAVYDEARKIWNGMIDRYPALIARCGSVADVQAAVNFAREQDLLVAVRGGGHNVAGYAVCEGGVVIDLSPMRKVVVDPVTRTARVEGGATLSDLDAATQAFGLAAPAGVVSATGVAGLTLGGGLGWLRRKYGLACDNLIAAEVVTADGQVVYTSESQHPELLWGLRGGGGNFGIVTSFIFRLYSVGPEVAFTFVFYPIARAREVLRFHEQFLSSEPGNVSTVAVLGQVPHVDAFPAEIHGLPFVGVLGMYAGEADEGMKAMRPLRELGDALVDMSAVMPYLEAQKIYDADYPNGHRYYWKSTNMNALTDEVIEILTRHAIEAPSGHSTIDIWFNGGAMGSLSANATAYGRRDIPYLINPEANWEHPEGDTANIGWARKLLAELEPHSAGGMYLNFPGFLEEGEKLVRASYGENYARLVALKTQYDPHNLFRRNQNIKPANERSTP
jgi:FAD/FMN-containing dehydrogenase